MSFCLRRILFYLPGHRFVFGWQTPNDLACFICFLDLNVLIDPTLSPVIYAYLGNRQVVIVESILFIILSLLCLI